jgi:hypothetical protein
MALILKKWRELSGNKSQRSIKKPTSHKTRLGTIAVGVAM